MARSDLDESRIHLGILGRTNATQAKRTFYSLQLYSPIIAHRPELVERVQDSFFLCHGVERYPENVSLFQYPDRGQEIQRGDHLVYRLPQVVRNISRLEPHSCAVAKEIERFTPA